MKAKVAQSCLTLCEPVDCSPWNSLGQNSGVGSLSLLQGIFPTQGLNPGLPHCRRFLYQLSHKGSPRILEWVAYPFSRVSSWPRNWTWDSPALQADSLPTELLGKPDCPQRWKDLTFVFHKDGCTTEQASPTSSGSSSLKNFPWGLASLLAQWLRIHLPM